MKQTTLEQPSVTLARTAVPKTFDPGNSVDKGTKLFLLLPPDDQPEASTESKLVRPDPTALITDPPSETPLPAPANFRPSMPTLLAGLAAMVGVAGFLAIRQQQLGINPSELIPPSEDSLSAVLDQTYEAKQEQAKQALTTGTLPPTQPGLLNHTVQPSIYTVKAGDTIEGIANQYQVSQQSIIQANQISDPHWLKLGQKLTIPSLAKGSAANPANLNSSPTLSVTIESNPKAAVAQAAPAPSGQAPTTHLVTAGETLSQIAEQYQVPQRAIMQANNLANSRWLSLGQKLVIPAPESAAVKPPAPSVKPKPIAALPPKLNPTKDPVIARQVKPTAPKPTQSLATHTIQNGDTIEGMALQYKISQRELLKANPQLDPLRLQLGQKLVIPGQDPVKPSQPVSQALKPKSTALKPAQANKPQPKPTTAAKLQALAEASRAKAVQASKPIAKPQLKIAAAKAEPPVQAPPKPVVANPTTPQSTAPKPTIEITKPKSPPSRAILPLDPGKPLPAPKPPVVESSPAQTLTAPAPSMEVKSDPIPELMDPPIAAKPMPQLNRLSKPELPAQPSKVTKLLQPSDPVPTVDPLPESAPVAAKPVPTLKRLDKPELPSQPSRVARLLNPVAPKQAPVEVTESAAPDAPAQAAPAPLPPVPPPVSAPATTAPPATSSSTRFIWPVAGQITSGFGWRGSRMHSGVDIPGPVGSPVVAVMDGVVIFAGNENDGYGNRVDIRHPNGLVTRYAHGSQVFVSTGQTVKQGQTIMSRGSTGWSTGPHVHFEVRPGGGAAVDPRPYLQ